MDTQALNLENVEDIQDRLKNADLLLETIRNNLNNYLEAKRKFFSRFYFLSNEDLIEVLGDSQKPRNIQKHLKKCFDGVNKVNFRPVPKSKFNAEEID